MNKVTGKMFAFGVLGKTYLTGMKVGIKPSQMSRVLRVHMPKIVTKSITKAVWQNAPILIVKAVAKKL